MITKEELYIISFYRASELAGSLLMGRMALHTDFDELRIPLTQHCLEEAEHGWLWTKTIKDLGLIPLKVTRTYQSEYGKEFGLPTSIFEVLCLTQVLELRVLEHFTQHLNKKGTHETIKKTLQKMIDDEAGHIGWVRKKLDEHEKLNGTKELERTMGRIEEVDRKVYAKFKETNEFKLFFE